MTEIEPIPYDEMRRLCGLPDFPDLRVARFFEGVPSNPWTVFRSPGDPGIESTSWTWGRTQYARRNYGFPERYIPGVGPIEAERIIAREEAIRGTKASQVIVDEPYTYGGGDSQWPDYMGAIQHILAEVNPLLRSIAMQEPSPEPDTRTPQKRALPKPSHTPPFWVKPVGTQRRTRTNSRRRHR